LHEDKRGLGRTGRAEGVHVGVYGSSDRSARGTCMRIRRGLRRECWGTGVFGPERSALARRSLFFAYVRISVGQRDVLRLSA